MEFTKVYYRGFKMDIRMSKAIEQIKRIIDVNQNKDENFKNFALEGGAGSGKTESLKEIITYISKKYPEKKIACITHTNAAVEEIIARVGDKFQISTIHSFLNSLIKNYKKNIKEVILCIFCIPNINEENHSEYKKVYEKYSNRLYSIKKENCDKVTGKRDYDKNPKSYNTELNIKINLLNDEIDKIILTKDHNSIEYNETRFDSFEELSFSHDSLLTIAYKLSEKFGLLPKIISDKYDFILIDEYQDTNEEIVNLFLELLPQNKKTTIGFFGDSMQGIYDDGIGDIKKQLEEGKLEKINKEDNYRCSQEVIDFINIIRSDDIEQKLALKKNEDLNVRKGSVSLYYGLYGKKPNVSSSYDDKNSYLTVLNDLIKSVKTEFKHDKTKILMLTNKSISTEIGFVNLYNIFNDRYTEVKEEIEKELSRILITDVVELCKLYQDKKYNPLLVYLKKNGFKIKSVNDKKMISDYFEYLINEDINIKQVLDYSFEKKLIRKSERYKNYLEKKDGFLKELEENIYFKKLEKLYFEGSNTAKRLKDNHSVELTDDEFNDFEKNLKKKCFYIDLFSDKLKFKEILNYYKYFNEETEYVTMHKTKGSGIENVIVVIDEYFWNKYNFKNIYDESAEPEKRLKNQKLFYVACSRTIKNLGIVRLVEDEIEEKKMKDYFKNCLIINQLNKISFKPRVEGKESIS